MADRRFTLVLYVALIVAAAATFGVYRVLQTNKEQSRIQTRPVVVAAMDLPEGAPMPKEALQVAEWPVAAAPEGAFAVPDSLVGRVARVAIFKGEAIVPGRLTPVGTSGGLEVKIAPGKRAMAIRINDLGGIAGLVQPNSRVDVLLTLSADPGNGQTQQVAKLFMENMRVLSMGTQLERGADGRPVPAPMATLEVTPAEAEKLAAATNMGGIQLVLRGYGETDSAHTVGYTGGDIIGTIKKGRGGMVAEAPPRGPSPTPRRPAAPAPTPTRVAAPTVTVAPLPPPKPDSATVTIIRGTQSQQQKFPVDSGVKKP